MNEAKGVKMKKTVNIAIYSLLVLFNKLSGGDGEIRIINYKLLQFNILIPAIYIQVMI